MLPYKRQSWFFYLQLIKRKWLQKGSSHVELIWPRKKWDDPTKKKCWMKKKKKTHESWFLLNEPNWESSSARTKGFIVTKFSEILLERDFASKKTKWYRYQNFILAVLHLKLLELLPKRIHSYIFSKKFHFKRKITYL